MLPCSHLPLIDAPYTAEVLCAGTSSTQAAKATVLLSVNFKVADFMAVPHRRSLTKV